MSRYAEGCCSSREWVPLERFGPFWFGEEVLKRDKNGADDIFIRSTRHEMPDGGETFETRDSGVQVELYDGCVEAVSVYEGPFVYAGEDWMGMNSDNLTQALSGSWQAAYGEDALNEIVIMFDDYGLIARASMDRKLTSFSVSDSWLD